LAHKTNLIPPIFIEGHVISQEIKRSCICVLRVLVLSISTIFLLDVGRTQGEHANHYVYAADAVELLLDGA
jgi:hypothetical protein